MALDKEAVLAALRTVQDPELFKDLVTLNMVKDIKIDGTHVNVNIELTTPGCPMKEAIRKDVENAIKQAGAESVNVEMSANTRGAAAGPKKSPLPQIKNIVAVGAGKGGVGKSTIAVNIAVALQRLGATTGVMDGDVYGPSLPTLLGIKGMQPNVRGAKIMPHFVHGVHAMTIGSLVEEDKPLIWRGPMAQGAFRNLLLDHTEWPELDYLIIDLPPGTGDVSLTLCQLLSLTGAVIVATPQQVALDDAVRAVRMFQQLGVPILGVVENMSYFVAPDGSEQDIFGRGGAERAAKKLNLNFLGALPMFKELRENSDAGNPELNFTGNPNLAHALEVIAKNVAGQVSKQNLKPAMPILNIT